MRAWILLLTIAMGPTVNADDATPPASNPPPPAMTSPAPPSSATVSGCASAQHRQFDFWLGEWEVFGKAGKLVGRSRIEAVLGGCALAEHWSSGTGAANDGTSLNLYGVRQFWETSMDAGKTWTVAFDGLYRRVRE